MTVKQFFKSAAFKCIIVLFSILIICGSLLTVAYGFLAVSKGEKLQRAINKIYSGGTFAVYGLNNEKIEEDNEDPKSLVEEEIEYDEADILAAYKIVFGETGETHYLVQSKGKGGYSGGTVTCWVAICVDEDAGSIKKIAKVQVGESSGQTFMNKITDKMLTEYTNASFEGATPYFDKSIKVGDSYRPYVSAGASLSSTAINHSVNGAVKYVKEVILNAADENPFASFELVEYINTNLTKVSLENGDIKYDVITKGYENASAFKITVKVNSQKKISYYKVEENGSTENWDKKLAASVINGSLFENADIDFFTGYYGADMKYASVNVEGNAVTTGASGGNASQSTYLCMYAGAFATKNYDAALAMVTGGDK